MIKLYQLARTGKTKFLHMWTEGAFFCREWGTTDSENTQTTKRECEGKNIGKSNETTPAQQAIVEMEAKCVEKVKNGYVLNKGEVTDTKTDVIDLDNIPESFCPSKPAKNVPKKALKDPTLFGQLKRNGHCIILVKTKRDKKVYSRGMEDLTDVLDSMPQIREAFDKMPDGTMILNEFCFVDGETGRDSPRKAGEVARQKTMAKAYERWTELNKVGHFELVPFDVMFHKGEFMGNTCYKTVRYPVLLDMKFKNVPPIVKDWEAFFIANQGVKLSLIEGLVMRVEGELSYIRFTLNGKADKCGAWKLKYVHEDDFIVTGAEIGKSGKQAGMYVRFHLSQYNDAGELVSYGNCGPGKLTHERLAELTEEISSGELKFPFVIEVEYQSRQEDSGCCEFPQFVRVRGDKKPEECIYA